MSYPTDIVVGSFYQTHEGKIAKLFGCGPRLVLYYFDDGQGGRSIPVEVVSNQWTRRHDLKDFPNASDPRLPYVFDLHYDLKHLSELKAAVSGDNSEFGSREIAHIRELIEEYGLSQQVQTCQ